MSIKMVAGGFGEALRRRRIEAGFTQEELAERAGMSARGVQDLERGVRRKPYPGTVRRLAEALTLRGADRLTFDECLEPQPPQATYLLVVVGSPDELLELLATLPDTAIDLPVSKFGMGTARIAPSRTAACLAGPTR
jgi:transcriptional regulator with XRE-family HTH domain